MECNIFSSYYIVLCNQWDAYEIFVSVCILFLTMHDCPYNSLEEFNSAYSRVPLYCLIQSIVVLVEHCQ